MRRQRASFIIVIVSELLVMGHPLFAQESELQAKFLSEYTPAEAKLKAFYRKVRMRGAIYTWDEKSGKEALDAQQVLLANGLWLRLERTEERVTKARAAGGLSVTVAGPYGFRLQKNARTGQFAILEITKEPKQMARNIWLNGPSFFAPFAFYEGSVADFFQVDDGYVKKFEDIGQGDNRSVKIWWGRKKVTQWSGWFLFAPERCWALQEYQWGSAKTTFVTRARFEYDAKEEAIPIIRRARYWREEAGKRIWSETHEITEVSPEEIAEEEFRLTAFNLPEPNWIAAPHGSRWYLWFGLAAIAALALSFLFRRLVRQLRHPAVIDK
jgi:hypothetical protein